MRKRKRKKKKSPLGIHAEALRCPGLLSHPTDLPLGVRSIVACMGVARTPAAIRRRHGSSLGTILEHFHLYMIKHV